MLRVDCGKKSGKYCDGLNRRSFLQIGMAGMGALGLPDLLRAKESVAKGGLRPGEVARKDTSVILIWLDGGPSHIDTYDMKPEAPTEYRGIWSPIPTCVPGIEVTELFPMQAKVADKYSVIRSMHHDNGDHFTGGHYMLTGKGGASGVENSGKHPFFGAAATKVVGPRHPAMPAHCAVPIASSIGVRPGYFGGNYLGKEHDPFETAGDPNSPTFKVQNLSQLPALDLPRLQNRKSLLATFDSLRREVDTSGALDAADRFQTQAYDLVTGTRAIEAFDISKETDAMRDRYGRHSWAQSTLLARRLVEAGSTFVSVHCGGWDHHWNLLEGYTKYLPIVDKMVSALLEDLTNSGLIDKTMVLLCGEFGRTPKMNDGGNGGPPLSQGTPGRDHWGNALSVLIAGAGVKGGRLIGSTDARAERPKDRPLTPGDLHATVFHVLGVEKSIAFNDFRGRPTHIIEQGDVIRELF
jgi:hypothetical protein